MKREPIPLTRLTEVAEAEGREGVGRLAAGAFLLEIPTETLDRVEPVRPGSERLLATPSSRWTEEYDRYDLLELRRVRGAGNARVFPLHPNTTAGRDQDCFVQVEAGDATAVSKRHALFAQDHQRWTLTDLGSTNGTFINRKTLQANEPQLLRPLDRVQLGNKRFVFLETNDVVALLTPIRSHAPVAVEALATELDGLGARHFLLRHEACCLLVDLVSKPHRDFAPQRAFPLVGREAFGLGRARESDLVIPHRQVSKEHARFLRREGSSAWWIEDVGSSFGTTLNGIRLAPNAPARVAPWDSLTFGDPTVRAMFADPPALLEFLVERGKG